MGDLWYANKTSDIVEWSIRAGGRLERFYCSRMPTVEYVYFKSYLMIAFFRARAEYERTTSSTNIEIIQDEVTESGEKGEPPFLLKAKSKKLF